MRRGVIVLAAFLLMATQGAPVGAQQGPQDKGVTQRPGEKGKEGRKGQRKRKGDEVRAAVRESRKIVQEAQATITAGNKVAAQDAVGRAVKLLAGLEKNATGPEARKVAAALRQETEQVVKTLQGEKPTPDVVATWGVKVLRTLRVGFRFARAKDYLAGGKAEEASQEVRRVAEFLDRQKQLREGAERRAMRDVQVETETLADRLESGEMKDGKALDQVAQKITKVFESGTPPKIGPPVKREKEK